MNETTTSQNPDYIDDLILGVVSDEFDVDKDKLLSGRRYTDIIYPLHLYRYLLRTRKASSYKYNGSIYRYLLREIGEKTQCHHATILHSYNTAKRLIKNDRIYRSKYESVMKKLPQQEFVIRKLY